MMRYLWSLKIFRAQDTVTLIMFNLFSDKSIKHLSTVPPKNDYLTCIIITFISQIVRAL